MLRLISSKLFAYNLQHLQKGIKIDKPAGILLSILTGKPVKGSYEKRADADQTPHNVTFDQSTVFANRICHQK